MYLKAIYYNFSIFFYLVFTVNIFLSNCNQNHIIDNTNKNRNISEVKTIDSIMEVKELLDRASPTTLIVFDIGETLVVQKNNLLRILRNHRIFDINDNNLINAILTNFIRKDYDAKNTILSNMLINSPLYFVEPEMKMILESLQKRKMKVIAHCSSKAHNLGAIKNRKLWRFSALKKMGIDFSSSFKQIEISLVKIIDKKGYYPIFYKGILFGNPKGKALSAFLDEVKFSPTEIICFDDCELFIKKYAREFKKRNLNFRGFIYKAALNPKPKLNPEIVDIQVRYMKKRKFIDDSEAEKISKKSKK